MKPMKTLLTLIISTLPIFGQATLSLNPTAWTTRNSTYNDLDATTLPLAPTCTGRWCQGRLSSMKVVVPVSTALDWYDLFPCNFPGAVAGDNCLAPFYGPRFVGSLSTSDPGNLAAFGAQVQADFKAGITPILTAKLTLYAPQDTVFIPTADRDFNARTSPCAGQPAFVRFYVSGTSDIGSTVRGVRWYSSLVSTQLVPGPSGTQLISMDVPVDHLNWTDVFAGTVDQYPSQFAASFANPQSIQIAMGSSGGCGYNHKIAAANATGAQVGITLTGYSIQ